MAPPEARTIVSRHRDNVRMLVLETDEPHPDTQREKGSFGEVMDELFKEAGEEHDPKLGIETVMMYAVEPDGGRIPSAGEIGKDIHAILITGSVYDAHSDEAWVMKLLYLIQGGFSPQAVRSAHIFYCAVLLLRFIIAVAM